MLSKVRKLQRVVQSSSDLYRGVEDARNLHSLSIVIHWTSNKQIMATKISVISPPVVYLITLVLEARWKPDRDRL